MCFSPYERKPWFLNLGNFCLWNLESWALESGIHLKESGIPRTIEIQNPSSTDKHWFFTLKNGDFGAACQKAALFNWLLDYNKWFFSYENAYICFFFLFRCQTMTEWNVHGLVSNKLCFCIGHGMAAFNAGAFRGARISSTWIGHLH